MAKNQKKENVKAKERGEEKGLRAVFIRFLGRYDFRNEEHFNRFGRWLVFIIGAIVLALVTLEQLNNFLHGGDFWEMAATVALGTCYLLSGGLKLFLFKSGKIRVSFYALDVLIAGAFLFFTDGGYPLILYLLVLTELYLLTKKTRQSVLLLCLGNLGYATSYALGLYMRLRYMPVETLLPIFTEAFGSIFIFLVHFVIVQIALAFYRQFLRLDKALAELNESKKELEKAYEMVAEVSVLEERQRIAKDIHDTAGHSITTVIMQTEAAKLIIDNDPNEAKHKIVAANLQAKHALEELRDSVHLLSGIAENQTLKSALSAIIHESTDGTEIKIRSSIEEVECSPAKARFLCNTLKEGISNGLRHGGATAFWFELKCTDGKIEFLLSDNGKGAGSEEIALGFGLTGMRERAKSLGGEVRFTSDEEGFEIFLTLPSTP